MHEINSNIDNLLLNGEPEEAESLLFACLDEMTDEASLSCDNGDFLSALEKYRLIFNLIERYYGDSVDLRNIEKNLAEIQLLM